MWRLKKMLNNTTAYLGKKYSFAGIRAHVKELVTKGISLSSGFITDKTKFIFRSRSAKIYVLFQMSKEMWRFSDRNDGQLYFETAVNIFLKVRNFFHFLIELGSFRTLECCRF
jgi:hypothetical protein